MIRCLSNVFSETGFLQILDGLTVNRTGIFIISKRTLSCTAAPLHRCGRPIGRGACRHGAASTGDGPEDASPSESTGRLRGGLCEIRLAGGGVCISASCQEDLERGTAYFATCYPLRRQGQKPAGPPGRKGAAVSDCFDRRWEDAASTRDYWNV